MINSKTLRELAGFLALTATTEHEYHKYGKPKHYRNGNGGSVDGRSSMTEAQKNTANGLTEFFYPGGSVWGLNQKNADRKAAKKGLIKN